MALQQRPLAIDLFAGCGGMSLGLEAAGFDVVAAVEIDPIHALVHEINFPYGATFCRDVTQIDKTALLRGIEAKGYAPADIDLLAGGPPCQGFSMMGKRHLADPRNRLVFEYVRLLREIQPKYFIFENVQGMATGQHQEFLQQLLSELREAGYIVLTPEVMNAAHYGAPQHRKRLILLGYRKDVIPVTYPEPTHGQGLQQLVTVQQAIADLVDSPIFTDLDQGIPQPQPQSKYLKHLKQNFFLCHQRTLTDNQLWGHLGSNHQPHIQQRFAIAPAGKKEKISRLFKLDAKGLSNTLRAGTPCDKGSFTAPRPIHYQLPRCISIREAARLHTFPDWFQFHRKVWHGFREIGNAVVPLLAQKLGEQIIHSLSLNPHKLTTKKLLISNDIHLSLTMNQAANYWKIPITSLPKRQRLSYTKSKSKKK